MIVSYIAGCCAMLWRTTLFVLPMKRNSSWTDSELRMSTNMQSLRYQLIFPLNWNVNIFNDLHVTVPKMYFTINRAIVNDSCSKLLCIFFLFYFSYCCENRICQFSNEHLTHPISVKQLFNFTASVIVSLCVLLGLTPHNCNPYTGKLLVSTEPFPNNINLWSLTN